MRGSEVPTPGLGRLHERGRILLGPLVREVHGGLEDRLVVLVDGVIDLQATQIKKATDTVFWDPLNHIISRGFKGLERKICGSKGVSWPGKPPVAFLRVLIVEKRRLATSV